MKSLLILIFLLLLLTGDSNSFAQDKDEITNDIRGKMEDIHLDTALKSVTLQNGEFLQNMTDGGGELTGFYKGKKIYRIYRSVGISNGVYTTEFYYWKNRLMYVRDQFNSYVYNDSLGTFDYTKINPTFNGYYYFKDEKLIDHRSIGHNRFEGDDVNVEKELLDESNEVYKLIALKIKSTQDLLK